MKNIDEKTSKIFIGAIIALFILVFIMLICMIGYGNSIKSIQHNNQQFITQTLRNIEIKNTKNENFEIIIKQNDSDTLNKITNEQYNDFLIKYNENQSNWLNTWLTILGIALAFIGLIAPLCFMKLYEDKKAEMDKIIEEARQQKDKAKLNVQKMEEQLQEVNSQSKKMEEQLQEVNSQSKKMEEQLQEVNNQSKKMEEDLTTVKKYVNEAQSLAKYTEGLNKRREDKNDEAEKLFLEAIELNSENDDAYDELGLLYCKNQDYDKAISYLKKAIAVKQNSRHYCNLSYAYRHNQCHQEAIDCAQKAIEKALNSRDQAFYISILSLSYSAIKDVKNTLKFVTQACNLNSSSRVLNNCAAALVNINKFNDAVKKLEQAIKLDKSAVNYYNLEEAYILNKQYNDALKTIKIYITKQNNKDCYGIFIDDYNKWIGELQKEEETPEIKELISIINTLEKRER